jgi:RNA polymerase sigma-70 factor (ECF subfamily)
MLGLAGRSGIRMIEADTEHSQFLEQFLPVRGLLRAFLHAATRNYHDTDDLCQQVGAVLWRKFDQYDPARPFAGWVIGIARMEVLKWRDRSVRAARQRSLSDEAIQALADAASESALPPETLDEPVAALRDCMEHLAPKSREVVQRKYRDGQAIKDIAAAQKREVGAVEMTLVRARRVLRQCIEAKLKAAGEPGPNRNRKD